MHRVYKHALCREDTQAQTWRSASTSRSSVAGPGRALWSVLWLWLPCRQIGLGHASVHASASAGQPAAGSCRCSPRAGTAPAYHTRTQTPASRVPRQNPWGPGRQRRHHSDAKPKAGCGGISTTAACTAAAARGTQTTRNRKYTGLPLTDFVSVDTGNANRESTEVDRNELEIH